ncbi:MAG: response regulator [Myxococcales bacterium]|nr:response regulator [Myxococcales bacterium]
MAAAAPHSRTVAAETTLELLRDVVFTTDERGRLLKLNAAWTAHLGHPVPRSVGRPLTDFVDAPDHTRVLEALDQGARARPVELTFVDVRGQIRCMEMACQVGPVGERVGTLHDITTRRRAQRSLSAAKARAEEAVRSRSTLLAHMSHELRTPLTAILGYAELLLGALGENPPLARHAETIRRNGEHLQALVNDILDFSKLEAGTLKVEMGRFEPLAMVHEVVHALKPRAAEKGLRLDVESGPLPGQVVSDARRVRQILFNLLGNALEFTERGGVRLRARVEGPELVFSVADTGPGMTPEQVERLFIPFVPGDTDLARAHGGAGLGLTIARQLARMLGGDITVRSVPGKGTAFRVALELQTGRTAAGTPARGFPSAGRLGGRRVLVVDDSKDLRALLGMFLRREGAEVFLAADGDEALDRLLRDRLQVDLVLMDIQMPHVDGHTATGRLRDAGYTGQIVALTAHATADDQRQCLLAGCDDYLTKPITGDSLVKSLERRLANQGTPNRARWTATPRSSD